MIREKIENTLALEYPKDFLQIVVISDESDDGTDEIVAQFPSVELFRQSPRQGKSSGINASFGQFRGEIVVFSDANAIYHPDAVSHLVRHFDDERVGYVAGRQMYRQGGGAAQESENAFWDFELLLKAWESRLSSVVGGDGAIMAIRRELFTPLKVDDINDFVLPLRMVVAGFQGRFEPDAVCYEEAAPSFRGEFRRKVRIVNRSLRAVSRVPQALNPFVVGIFAAQLFCHKVVRWFAVFLMLGALVNSGVLAFAGLPAYVCLFAAQLCSYVVALAARWTPLGNWKPAMLLYYFCMANIAGGLGVLNFFVGRKFVVWTPQRDTVATGAEPTA
ncbi:glycosyltransferase family 2 protein [Stieleria sp. TO1_6]|nr:glycosyltransferase family 2 protein [Stieleria tagensis]